LVRLAAPASNSAKSLSPTASPQQVLSVQPVDTAAPVPIADAAEDGCVPSWLIDASGIRRLPDRCPNTAPASAAAAPVVEAAAGSDSCAPSWVIDGKGIQRVRSGCAVDGAAEQR
jgi:hypothetical protein